MEIEECVICGQPHVHGAPDDLSETFNGDDRPHRMAHCRTEDVNGDAPTGYYLELSPIYTLSGVPWFALEEADR